MTKFFKGRVACCILNKIGGNVKYYIYGISNSNVYDSFNGVIINNSS